jgi:hypothetical protein
MNNVEMTDEEYRIYMASRAVHLGMKTFADEQALIAYRQELARPKEVGCVAVFVIVLLLLILATVIFGAIVTHS